MKTSDLYRLMEDPSLLTAETLPELKQIVDDFPYFHTASMLYLKNLALLDDIRFAQELKRIAVSIPDRKKLFMLIEGDRYKLVVTPLKEESAETTDSFSLIDSFLSSYEESKNHETNEVLTYHPSISSDYVYWSFSKDESAKPDASTPKLQGQELIDSFIENDENRPQGVGLKMDTNTELAPPLSVGELEDEEYLKTLDDSYFTETLARIYVKQKRYDKALQIIKNLSLKYPEKNLYFADQIRFLEKLIINIKKYN